MLEEKHARANTKQKRGCFDGLYCSKLNLSAERCTRLRRCLFDSLHENTTNSPDGVLGFVFRSKPEFALSLK